MTALQDLEPVLNITPGSLSPQKEMVRKFYKDMWDRIDLRLVPEIFHPDFTFRGSLGPTLVGYSHFGDYVRWVTDALADYTSDIVGMVEEGNKVSGKLRFHGIHRGVLFGQPPTGRHVWWYGAPIFTFDGSRVRDLWVLGDVHGLVGRLDPVGTKAPEFKNGS